MPDADGIIVIWFKLLCLAGKTNHMGILMLNDRIPYNEEMLSQIFRRPLGTIRLALATFERYGMIEIINGTITIPNWDKHQKLGKLEESRELTRRRVSAYRERQKQLLTGETESPCNALQPVTVTHCNADREREEKEGEKEKEEEKESESEKEPSLPLSKYSHAAVAADISSEGCCCRGEEAGERERGTGIPCGDREAVLRAAESAGFARNEATRDQLLRLLEKYGRDSMLKGIRICVKRGKFSPGYLEGCITHPEGQTHREIVNPFAKLLEERSAQENGVL